MGDPAPMHTHYSDTVDFDWAAHFIRQRDSGLSVRAYCRQQRCSRATWFRVKRQYDAVAAEDRFLFSHTKRRPGVEPLLSSSGEGAVSSALERTSSGIINAGIIKETVRRRLFEKYHVQVETLSRAYTVKLMKRLDFFYGHAQYKSFNKMNVPDSTLLNYQQQYNQLMSMGVSLNCILNVDATRFAGDILPKKTYKKRQRDSKKRLVKQSAVNSGTHNAHLNTSHFFSLVSTVSADGAVLPPFFVAAKKHINKFRNANKYHLVTGDSSQPIYAHNGFEYYVAFTMYGSVNTDIMLQYLSVVVNEYKYKVYQPTVYLTLDAAVIHRTIQFSTLAAISGIELLHIPANTTHMLQPNDLVVFGQLKSHVQTEHNKIIVNQGVAPPLEHFVEYSADYVLRQLDHDSVAFSFHFAAHATITELRKRNWVYKAYTKYRTAQRFDDRVPGEDFLQ